MRAPEREGKAGYSESVLSSGERWYCHKSKSLEPHTYHDVGHMRTAMDNGYGALQNSSQIVRGYGLDQFEGKRLAEVLGLQELRTLAVS